jgi:hypothetical protein
MINWAEVLRNCICEDVTQSRCPGGVIRVSMQPRRNLAPRDCHVLSDQLPFPACRFCGLQYRSSRRGPQAGIRGRSETNTFICCMKRWPGGQYIEHCMRDHGGANTGTLATTVQLSNGRFCLPAEYMPTGISKQYAQRAPPGTGSHHPASDAQPNIAQQGRAQPAGSHGPGKPAGSHGPGKSHPFPPY